MHAWREELAGATDVPAFKLLSNEALLEMAVRPPRAPADVARVRGLSPRVRARADELLAAIDRGLGRSDAELPRLDPAPPRPSFSDAERRRIESLRAWRTAEAVRLGVDVSVVLPQRLLERLAQAAPRDVASLSEVDGLRRWRVEAFGPGLVAAAGA